MYLEFFRLHESPFSLDPDPRFLYPSPAHATARAYLDYTVESRDGMVVLTGHAGCGKSILVADLCRRVDRADILLLEQSQLDPHELLQSLLLALAQDCTGDRPQLRARLREVLCERLAEGRRMTLIVDEAQHLPWETLEALRMLCDQQEQGRRLLAVILVGQLGLARTLKTDGLEQLRQRVRLFYTLEPLPRQEIRRYIDHRLTTAGSGHAVVISPRAMQVIRKFTGGVPRLINTLMDMTLTAAALERTRMISARLVIESARELQWEPFYRRHARMFLSDRWRDVRAWAVKTGRSASALASRLPALAMPDLAPLRRIGKRLPTQWLAGLGGAALIILPAALLLPVWMAQVQLEQSIADTAAAPPGGDRPRLEAVIEVPRPTWTPHSEPPSSRDLPATVTVAAAADTATASSPGTAVPPSPPAAQVSASPSQPASPLKDANWLLRQPADAYSVQLFAASSAAGVERFLQDHGHDFRGDRELAAFTAARDGEPWYVLVLASYPNYSITREAIAQLPVPLQKHQPWIRRIEMIQASILDEASQAALGDGAAKLGPLVAGAATDPDGS